MKISSFGFVAAAFVLVGLLGCAAAPSVSTPTTVTVATPVFSVAGGTYTTPQGLTLTAPGETIYYTTNGTTPTTSSTLYTGPITITTTETIEAIAVLASGQTSAVVIVTYTLNLPVLTTPAFNVAGGAYTAVQTVAITDSTPGALVYFTTNGTTPTAASTLYSGPVTVSTTETLEAVAIASGYTSSGVATATYTITLTAATPVFSVPGGAYTAVQTVAITDATAGASIYYTTNGATPTAASTLYSGPITVGATETLEAIAIASGYVNSAVATATYTITLTAATPVFSVPGGTYTTTQTVAITDATAGASIYYTTNGSTPSALSTLYSGPLTVSAAETVQAIAVVAGYTNRAVALASYVIAPVLPTPVLSVAGGTYTTAQTVAITDTHSGVAIYYTTNGTTPTTSSALYSAPITVSATETVEAIAVLTAYTNSAVATATYTIAPVLPTPTFSVAGGSYTIVQTVAITDGYAGASIYYTTNGTTPTASSTLYTGALTVTGSETVEAIAVATGYTNSAVGTAVYVLSLVVPTPVFNAPAGTYSSAQTVTITDALSGATIYYTTNGTTPTAGSTLYSGPISVSATETLKAIAVASGYANSLVGTASYTIGAAATATPVISLPGGTYPAAQTVAITDTTAGASIYYTTNGTTPTSSSTLYAGPFPVNATETLEAVAVATGYANSAVASASYGFGNHNEWTWMGASYATAAQSASGNFGTLGVESASNAPPGRYDATTWVDGSGNLWMMGGTDGVYGANDLWKFDLTTNEWVWMGGVFSSTYQYQNEVGALGVPTVGNNPGGQVASSTWTDRNGNLWLLSTAPSGAGGTLWMYNTTTNLWAFFGGHSTASYGTLGVAAASNSPGARGATATWADNNGNLWLLGVGVVNDTGVNDLWRYNIATNLWTWMGGPKTVNTTGSYGTMGVTAASNQPPARATAAWGVDSTGSNVWLFGGAVNGMSSSQALYNDLWNYNIASGQWTWVGGSNLTNQNGVFGTQGVAASTNQPPSRQISDGWVDSAGNFWVYGGLASSELDDLWEFLPATNQWVWVGGSATPNIAPTYGILGVPAAGNILGARAEGVIFTDKSGNFWMFDGIPNSPYGNDLWRYEP